MYVLYMASEQQVSPDWASLTPGAELAGLLEQLTLTDIPNAQIVPVLTAAWRQISHLHALYWAAMVQVGEREPVPDRPPAANRPDQADLAWQAMGSWHWATHQISAALTFSGRRTDDEYGVARQLVGELPLVWEALSAGRLDPPKAKVFARYLINLTAAQSELICRRLLPRAPRWTTGQLAHRLLREILAIDPTYSRRRYEKAARERGVWGYIAEDGTAVLAGHGLSPTEAAAAAERLEQLAAAVRAAGHPHTEVQLRADLFIRLLDGRYTGFTTEQIVTGMLTDTDSHADGTPECPAESGATESGATESGATESGATESGATESGTADTDPGAATPDVATPGAARPDDASSDNSSTAATSPAAEHDASDLAVAEPDPADSVLAGLDRSGSDPVRPAPRDPVLARLPVRESEHSEPVGMATPPERGTAPAEPPGPQEGVRSGIEIRVGLSTLLGLDDHPGELPGWGPIDASEARLLAGRQRAAEWRFAVLDDDGYLIYGGLTRRRPTNSVGLGRRTTGSAGSNRGVGCRGGVVEIHARAALLTELQRSPHLPPAWAALVGDIARQYADRDRALAALDADPAARLPNAGLRRHVQMRDRTCMAPGCRRPARKAELDHTRDHARGGPTVRANAGPLCLQHHMMKHHDGWTLTQPEPGRFCWISPLGQLYRTRGEPVAPDLPEPVPGPEHDPPDDIRPAGATADTGPIFHPAEWQKLRPPELPPEAQDGPGDDEPPPF
jgi:hypothetical protein